MEEKRRERGEEDLQGLVERVLNISAFLSVGGVFFEREDVDARLRIVAAEFGLSVLSSISTPHQCR
jgi:hypothetical protein